MTDISIGKNKSPSWKDPFTTQPKVVQRTFQNFNIPEDDNSINMNGRGKKLNPDVNRMQDIHPLIPYQNSEDISQNLFPIESAFLPLEREEYLPLSKPQCNDFSMMMVLYEPSISFDIDPYTNTMDDWINQSQSYNNSLPLDQETESPGFNEYDINGICKSVYEVSTYIAKEELSLWDTIFSGINSILYEGAFHTKYFYDPLVQWVYLNYFTNLPIWENGLFVDMVDIDRSYPPLGPPRFLNRQ